MISALFCFSKSMAPIPPSVLGTHINPQAAFGLPFSLIVDPRQRQCFLYLSICLMIDLGSIIEHMKKVGRAENTALTS